MRDGLYRLLYAGAAGAALGVFALRNGAFSGIGEKGAQYHGTYVLDVARKLYTFHGAATFLPNTPTVTGYAAGPDGSVVPFSGECSAPEPRSRFSLAFASRAVDVSIEYVCPIPG